MILDWYSHCNKVLKNDHLDREDPSDNKSFFKQEVIYVRFLIDRGYTKDEVREKWLALDNGVASEFRHDKEQLLVQFNKTYDKARSNSYSFVSRCQPLSPISLTKAEIKKLNSLHAEKWIKEYLLGLLVFYKFSTQRKSSVEYSPTLSNWLLRQIRTRYRFRSYRDARGAIMKVIREAKPRPVKFFPVQKGERYTSYSMPTIMREEDSVVCTISDLNSLTEGFAYIKDNKCVCAECGKVFTINSKTKRTLCEECYKKYRRKYKTAKDKEYYYRDKE